MRVVAILAAYNEERFIGGCLDHLVKQGVEAYLIDNCSTDRTVEIAREYLGRGLIDIETLPRPDGVFSLNAQFRSKEKVANSLDADWFMHMDPDEIRLAPNPDQTLAEAFEEVDAQGYNAANFLEFTFIPTKESPEHDHPDFQETMRWYYPFMLRFPQQVKAWKKQPGGVNLTRSNGHKVDFPGLCLYPESFKMKHYQFLSLSQARTKYLENKKLRSPEDDINKTWRTRLVEERMGLPSESELNTYTSDAGLSLANPWTRHVMEGWALPEDGQDAKDRAKSGTQIVVAGFHRSGTSLAAQILELSGVFLGHEKLPEHRSNPHGHFEDREIVTLHDMILKDSGLTWQVDGSSLPVVRNPHRRRMQKIVEKRNAEQEIWGFKDPRVSLFMDAWKDLLPDVRVLMVYRSFAESTYSLHRRAANGFLYRTRGFRFHRKFWNEPDLALKMWLAYNKALVEFANAHPENVLAVSFDMLRKGFPLIEALNQRWGLSLEERPTVGIFDPNATTEPSGKQLVSDEKLIGEVLETWEALEKLGKRTQDLTGIPVETDGKKPTEESFYVPKDAYAAEMAKVFAEFESHYAREKLREAESSLEEAENHQRMLGTQLEAARENAVPPPRRSELQSAEKDLKLIVQRVSGSKLAPLFRLKKEFRELERRYPG